MLATVKSAGAYGVESYPVEVEVNVAGGDFSRVALVGLPDAAVKGRASNASAPQS